MEIDISEKLAAVLDLPMTFGPLGYRIIAWRNFDDCFCEWNESVDQLDEYFIKTLCRFVYGRKHHRFYFAHTLANDIFSDFESMYESLCDMIYHKSMVVAEKPGAERRLFYFNIAQEQQEFS
jgi:hypothetical protein